MRVKYFIHLFFLLKLTIFCMILGQGANIQILPHKKLDDYKQIQFYKTVKIQARRGRIYDRKGKELAINEPSYSVYADPENVKSPRWASNKLSRLLKLPNRQLEQKMRKNTRFVWLKRKISPNTKKEIQKLNLSGIHFVGEPNRQYPGRDISSSVLGFVGVEGKGLEGIEFQYDKYLSGKDIELKVSRDAKGRPLFIDPQQYTEPPEGKDLVLTIDSEYQRYLEIQLKKTFEDHEAKTAYGLIVDVETGAVRASAQWPAFDANSSIRDKNVTRKNLNFSEAQEQGSTIKTFAIGAALENKVFRPGSEFACLDGKIKLGRRVISDAKKIKCETMTLTEGLKVSSNVVLTQMALAVGEKKMRAFYNQLGFGEKTKIDFPGESKGIYRSQRWPGHLLASASFGHGFTATPIQVASIYAAIASDGIWKQPYMVESVIAPTGFDQQIERTERRVMSAQTAQTLKAMLTEVTQDGGTGFNASVEGYLVAGKTGTANKVNLEQGGYYKDRYLSSFVGMIPAEKPKFVIYIAVDEPQKKYYGSEAAAPVFSKVAQFLMNKENIAPTNIMPSELLECENKNCKYTPLAKSTTDSLHGLTIREVLRILKDKPVEVKFHGHGLVSKVIFEEGENLHTKSKVVVQLD